MVYVKRKIQNYKYLFILIIFIVMIYYLFSYYKGKDNNEITHILGISEAFILSTDFYCDNFTIQDYDAIEIYQLSENTVYEFVKHSSFELNDKPYENDSTRIWIKQNWRETPIDSIKLKAEYELAFAHRIDNKKRNKWSSEICHILASNHAYYAFYSSDNQIAFYTLDVNGCKLYIVYVSL